MTDARVFMAANNNADLYEAVFASHGLECERSSCAFIGWDRPPPYYANLTVTSQRNPDEVMSQLRRLALKFDGIVCIKDSFCQFDLSANGFEELFSASWLWREARTVSVSVDWEVIEEPSVLEQWEAAWKQAGSPADVRMFNEEMLLRPDIHFLCKRRGDDIEAGCIANVSSDCIGLSNVFSKTSAQVNFAEAADAVAAIEPNLPIVGYESEAALDAAQLAGFEVTGSLRILVASSAKY